MTQAGSPNDPQIEFEKWKIKIELFKWSIVSVLLVVVTIIIDAGFRDRSEGIKEVESYGKYATELVILNDTIGPRYRLAQYFANVTASEKLKRGWISYFNVLQREVDSLKQITLINDNIIKTSSDSDKVEKSVRENEEIKQSLTAPVILPNNIQQSNSIPTVFIQILNSSLKTRAANLQSKLLLTGFLVPGLELVNDRTLDNNEIRYYYESDYPAVSDLRILLEKEGLQTIIKPLFDHASKVKPGVIELWIKNF
ncbi:MAG TPA: hypothetical protein VF868_13610 [Bacteroidia bacterium]|jgi:hypothetical protein